MNTKTRMEMIGEIRTMLPQLWDANKFELAKEIMGDIHQDNFSGIPESTVRRIWLDLCDAMNRLDELDARCHYCRTGEGHACDCV